MGIKIIKAGVLSTIQDLGRQGYQQYGIIVSGAMDKLALRIGNLLVGNAEDEAGIECTLVGPSILFEESQLIAITGGHLSPAIDGLPVEMWRPIWINKGAVLSFGRPVEGCRAYICIKEGLRIPEVLGSHSTYLRARFGGWQGRALKAGDKISFNRLDVIRPELGAWSYRGTAYPDLADRVIRAVKGPEVDWFTPDSIEAFEHEPFVISPSADRMGYRLVGPKLMLCNAAELLSTAVAFGTIQVPGDGNPIALMADHQTTGGYPRIAQVITADQSKLAQLQSGDAISFKFVSLAEAREALVDCEKQLRQLGQALSFKYEIP